MIQDIFPSRFSLEYKHPQIKDEDYVIIGNLNKEVYLYDNDLPVYGQIKNRLNGDYQFLFSIDEDNYFMCFDTAEDMEFIKVRMAMKILKEKQAFACATGYHLYNFYMTHRYCGVCSNKLIDYKKERALYCEKCGQLYYPVIAPAIIIGVTNCDKILMSSYAGRDYKGKALIAGFCEIGETVEETCSREVMEEVGIKIKNIRYYKSQPWGVDANLLLGFFAEVDGDDTLHVDHNELATADWVSYKDIEPNDNTQSLTSTIIEEFRRSFTL